MSNDKLMYFNQELKKHLPKKGTLAEAMSYSVFAGGKRFRPLLCLYTAIALGKAQKKILPIACAIEYLHTFTLIHDDLPSMDNSDLRRGRPTCHKQYDEATAILAGDALQALAFQLLAEAKIDDRAIAVIGKALLDVVEGQVMDMASVGKEISYQELLNIHEKKTAALLIACTQAVAIELKAKPQQLKALTEYAKHLGLAFQIADDILDVTATSADLGKPAGADVGKGFPHFLGLDESKKQAILEKERAIKALKPFGKRGMKLVEMAEYVVERNC